MDDPIIKIEKGLDDLSQRGAELFVSSSSECIAERGLFTVALSGGTTPRGMHALLSEEPYLSGIDWEKIHIFWSDERCVPQEEPESNYGNAVRDFLQKVPISPSNVHPMSGMVEPHMAAGDYEAFLRDFFRVREGEFPVFDLIFLGLGKDGHTASIFPGRIEPDEKRLVISVNGGEPVVDRISLALPVINNARKVAFLVSGISKAPVVKEVIMSGNPSLPAAHVRPNHGELIWFLDVDAASLLP